MPRHHPTLCAVPLVLAWLAAPLWSAPPTLAGPQEVLASDLLRGVEAGTDTVIEHPDGSLETRPKDPGSLGQGSWIRFRTRSDPEHEREGRVEAAAGDWIEVIEKDRTASSVLRLNELESLRLRGPSGGRSGGVQVGALVGAVSGLVIGGAIGSHNEPDCTPNSWFCYKGFATFGGAMLGGAIGAVAGGLVGLAVTPDGWVEVPLVSLEARAEGAILAIRVPVR